VHTDVGMQNWMLNGDVYLPMKADNKFNKQNRQKTNRHNYM